MISEFQKSVKTFLPKPVDARGSFLDLSSNLKIAENDGEEGKHKLEKKLENTRLMTAFIFCEKKIKIFKPYRLKWMIYTTMHILLNVLY